MCPGKNVNIIKIIICLRFGTSRSFAKRMSSFVRGIFRRGSYNINHPKTANKSTNCLARRPPRCNQPVCQPLNHRQPVNQLSKCRAQKTNIVQRSIHSKHIYSERAIDVGDLVESVSTVYHSAQDQLDYIICSFNSRNSNHPSASMYNLVGSYDEQHDCNNQLNAVNDEQSGVFGQPVQIAVFHYVL